MIPEMFDRIVARTATRRGAFGVAAAFSAMLAGRATVARAQVEAEGSFSRDCDRFVLVGENKRKGWWDNVDDNMLIELFPKGSKRSEVIWDDTTDNQVNYQGQPFRIKEFDARVGDKIQITAYNVEGTCELDEIWLFCADGGRGKRMRDAIKSNTDCPASGMFWQGKFRIKP
jgi:hypothetical protein